MRNIKLTIEYDGTSFNGWQTQSARRDLKRRSGQGRQRTVQAQIEKALREIFKKNIKLTGSGRTDSGVHALGQVANFKTCSALTAEKICAALNAHLPEDIAIIKAEEAAPNFHAQYSVKSKTYRYTLLNRCARTALERNFSVHYPRKLNVRSMRAEAKTLIGRHDFRSFTATDLAKRKKKIKIGTVRTIKRLNITKRGDYLFIDIEANGFLYKMVRNIVGTLLEVGSGKRDKGSFRRIMAQKDRRFAGVTAKAKGLALMEVKY